MDTLSDEVGGLKLVKSYIDMLTSVIFLHKLLM